MKTIIVGGGIIGATVAHELSKRGIHVVLLEAKYFTYGATGRATGSITVQQRARSIAERALETIELWKKFRKEAEELGIPFAQRFMMDESPHLAIALNEEEYIELKEMSKIWSSVGAKVKELEPEETRDYFPPLEPARFYKALATFNDIKAMPHPYTWARIAAARINGAKTYTYEKVVGLKIEGENIIVSTDTGKKFEADNVIIAAGAASIPLMNMAGDSLTVDVKAMYAGGFVTEPFKYEIKATIRLHKYSFRFLQTVRNEYVATIDNMGYENKSLSTEDSLEFLEKVSTLIVKLMPTFAYVNIMRSWGAFVDYTSDGLPIVGWSKRFPDKVYYIFGFNDYGLSAGPAIAVRAAKEVAEGIKDPLLEEYRPR